MIRKLVCGAVIVLSSVAHAAHPYDSVGRISPAGMKGGGSCVLVGVKDGKGLVVTAGHVCDTADTFDIYWPKVDKKQEAKTIAVSLRPDLAFLVVEEALVPPLRVGVRDGNIVFAGFPTYDREHLHWQHGIIQWESTTRACWRNPVVPGMSGGAVFDRKDGDLCGIITSVKKPWGYGISDLTLMAEVVKYKEKEWIPDGSHVAKKLDFGPSAKWNKNNVVTKKYDPEEAPDLDYPDYNLQGRDRKPVRGYSRDDRAVP